MRRFAAVVWLCLFCSTPFATADDRPRAEKRNLWERRFGLVSYDPYRWMENSDDLALEPWLRGQAAYTEQNLAGPLREAFFKDFTALLNPAQKSAMGSYSDRWERYRERRDERRYRIPGRAAFNTTTPDGQGVVGHSVLSPSGGLEIVTLEDTGRDLKIVRIKDKKSGQFLSDILQLKFFEIVWEDDTSFLYTSDYDGRMGSTLSAVRRHKIGKSQSEDALLFEASSALHYLNLFRVQTQFIVQDTDSTSDFTTLWKLSADGKSFNSFLTRVGSSLSIVGASAERLFASDMGLTAPMGRVLAFDLTSGAEAIVVPEFNLPLTQALYTRDGLFLAYLDQTVCHLRRQDVDSLRTVVFKLEAEGSCTLSLNTAAGSEGETLLDFSTYQKPSVMMKYDPKRLAFVPEPVKEQAPFPIEASRIFYRAHNGKDIPIWLIRKQGVDITTGKTPTYLYGYGGFSVNILPGYNKNYIPWLKRGGVIAIATLPGGAEYGETWHQAGMLTNKRNVFDDFARAGEELVAQKVTDTRHLAIGGGSNGGLLVAATMNLYPEHFHAAVPEVGVMDLLRFPLFTGGKWWLSEYGDPRREVDYKFLHSISPYQQIRRRPYPATLIVTADSDDRVVPAHSYKYAARLMELQEGEQSVLLHINRGSSHSSRSGSLAERIRLQTNKWSFLARELGMAPDSVMMVQAKK